MAADDALRHIVTKVTDEGLIIEIHDLKNAPLFEVRGAEPTDVTGVIVGILSRVMTVVQNDIAVAGYVSAQPLVVADNPVWDLSTKRADRIREMLEADGTLASRIQRVTGHADRKPATRNPISFRNNRVEIVLLRSQGAKK